MMILVMGATARMGSVFLTSFSKRAAASARREFLGALVRIEKNERNNYGACALSRRRRTPLQLLRMD